MSTADIVCWAVLIASLAGMAVCFILARKELSKTEKEKEEDEKRDLR